ncbi:MAG: ABC transporter substrate-binding protein [Alphaproteobacteria bacterium]|nr:ABC transporter substrate-binding protein [Alphaproteobacteria bacterium]
MTSRRQISRRALLTGAAGAGVAGALLASPPVLSTARAEGIEQRAVEIAAVRDPQLGAQVAIASEFELFQQEGLEPAVHWNQSGADVITVMAGGSQYLGTGGVFAEVVFGGQDLPIKIVAALADIAATQGFALSPGVKLAHPRELEGKRLAFTQGNSQVLILAKMAKMFGFDAGKVTLVNMNPSEGVVAASKGDVHGLLGWQPNLYRLVTMGGTMYATGTTLYVTDKPESLPLADRLQYNHSVLLASQGWIDNKPNTVKAVLRALRKATDILTQDRPKALDALQKQLRIDADALKVMAEANQYGLGISDAVAASLDFQSQWALEIKRIAKPVTPEQGFAPQLLQSLDPGLVTWKARA